MKNIIILVISILYLTSCNNGQQQADAYGNFELRSTTISAENAGKLKQFDIEEGDLIESGVQIGLIDTLQLHLKKKQLEAAFKSISSQSKSVLSQIDVLKEQLEIQKNNRDRIQKMYKDGAATKKQLDDANGQVEVTNRQILSVKAQNASVMSQSESLNVQIRQIEDQISKSVLINPLKGTVLVKYAEQHEFTAPGKPLYLIQNLEILNLKAYVTQPQLSEIALGQKVKVGIDTTDEEKQYEGVIYWINSRAEFTPKIIQTKDERQNLVYAIKIRVKNDGSLKLGMPASVYFK